MKTLKYKVIKDQAQYNEYCRELEKLLENLSYDNSAEDEVDLLTLLIEKWDEEHNTFHTIDPIQLLQSLMADNNMKPKDIMSLLKVSKGYVSEILNYKKGLSKEAIRILAEHFKVSQEAFNRKYALKTTKITLHTTHIQ